MNHGGSKTYEAFGNAKLLPFLAMYVEDIHARGHTYRQHKKKCDLHIVAFGGGARYGGRRQVFSSLLKFLHASGVSLDPMDDCKSCAFMNWKQYAVN